MHAHVLASPSIAEDSRKHLTVLKAYRDREADDLSLAYDDGGGDWLLDGDDVSVVRLKHRCEQASNWIVRNS